MSTNAKICSNLPKIIVTHEKDSLMFTAERMFE